MEKLINRVEIDAFDKIFRINLINSITGIKPANLIGTQSLQGQTNLAIFSSVIHMGSNPPLIGMVSRPTGNVERHTLENIEAMGYYTINHLHIDRHRSGHYTSAKFPQDISEFEICGFEKYYSESFAAPYVKGSKLGIGMKFIETIDIKYNGTVLILGEVQEIRLNEVEIAEDGSLNLEEMSSTGISGLDTYYKLEKVVKHPFARVEEL